MTNRRDFLTGATVLFSKSVLGANDRINYAFIGLGGRLDGDLLGSHFLKQPDGELVAICDCNRNKMEAYRSRLGKNVQSYVDYRQLMERKDIDAVVIVTPDHIHAPVMIAALETGKDVYVEKPASNTVEAAVAMLKAYREHKQVVQLGTQQRSWDHFQEAAKMVRDGVIGNVEYVLVGMSGGMGGPGRPSTAPSAPPPIPEGLNWDLFLGPAKKVPYDPARLGWRGWFDYGGGQITDFGAHWLDIVHLAMGTDKSGPTYCQAIASYPSEDRERVPGSYVINYTYPKFLMTQTCYAAPTPEPIVEGPTFLGSRGYIRVNRFGYIVRRNPVSPYATRAAGGRAGAPGGPGGMPGGGRAQMPAQPPPLEEKQYVLSLDDNIAHQRIAEGIHVRNFFDCIKSRQKPTAEFEIGFHSTLPGVLGRTAVKDGRPLIWDESSLTAKPA